MLFQNNDLFIFSCSESLLLCGGSLVGESGSYSLAAEHGLLRVFVAARGFSRWGEWELLSSCGARALAPRIQLPQRVRSVALARGLSSSAAVCGIFLDQGSNPCPLLWQADPHPLSFQDVQEMNTLTCRCNKNLNNLLGCGFSPIGVVSC